MTRRVCAIAACVCALAGWGEAETPDRTVFSPTRRFVVSGLPVADATMLAQWMEDVARRYEEWTRDRLVFRAGEYIAVRTMELPGEPPRVTRAQGYVDGRLHQRLVLVNPAAADQEDLLENLCALLLNRQVAARQTESARASSLGRAPDWIACGTAQNLYKELRARNIRIGLELLDQDLWIPIARVFEQDLLPPGRWREKYFCGLAVAWMWSRADAGERWERLLRAFGSGETLSLSQLANEGFGRDDVLGMDAQWRAWVLSRRDDLYEGSPVEGDRMESLAAVLALPAGEWGVSLPEDTPRPLTPQSLIEQRKESWARAAAAAAGMRLQWVGLGQDPEFQSIIEQYVRFFSAVADRKSVASERTLRRQLEEADRGFARYRAQRQGARQYLNQVGQWLEMDEESVSEAGRAPALPSRTDVQRYMDDVERQWNAGEDATE